MKKHLRIEKAKSSTMKEIHVEKIIDEVRNISIDSNYFLNDDVKNALNNCHDEEEFPMAKDILDKIIKNADIAKEKKVPICQDTGAACVFVEIGQDVHIVGGLLEDAINEGVRRGYKDGYLRKSVVKDPLNRINTGDNTPAFIKYDVTLGDKLKIVVAPKGFGSENMSTLKMLKPSDGILGVKKFVIETVKEAGPNPCPPIIVGVGIGGNFDFCAHLAKKAALRSIDVRNKDEYYRNLEEELLEEINKLGIGPQGFGGKTTSLAVNIEYMATHIAGLPVAVNINCHAARHREVVL